MGLYHKCLDSYGTVSKLTVKLLGLAASVTLMSKKSPTSPTLGGMTDFRLVRSSNFRSSIALFDCSDEGGESGTSIGGGGLWILV